MYKKRGIVWFRQDLRLHDNEALTEALDYTDEVVPVYVFDERLFKGHTSRYGFRKIGHHRAQFIIESVDALRKALREKGSDLVIRVGKPEEEVYELAKLVKPNWVFCNRERTRDEMAVQDELEQRLWTIGQEMRYSRGKLLYYTADLPFPITHTPDTFAQFRKETERYVPIRKPLPTPEKMPDITLRLAPGDLPALEDFGHEATASASSWGVHFEGGESAGLKRLKAYIWAEEGGLPNYRTTSDALTGWADTSKLSPWLAQGCVSPKMVYHELQKYKEARLRGHRSAQALFQSLLRRDFFRLIAKKYGDAIFEAGGTGVIQQERIWSEDTDKLHQWINGKTGMPFIDANMQELAQTGYLSNRGRQNVASYLIYDLGLNWQMGAEYFEFILIDYDIASNWCNWHFAAGVGSDPREQQELNVPAQAQRYDGQGEYVRRWLPPSAFNDKKDAPGTAQASSPS